MEGQALFKNRVCGPADDAQNVQKSLDNLARK